MRQSLLALSALTLPAAAFAQANWPVPGPVPPPPAAAVAEPWMAQPAPATQQPAPSQSPNAGSNKGPALEPIDLPPAIEQGVDMIYVDQDLVPPAVHDFGALHHLSFDPWARAR